MLNIHVHTITIISKFNFTNRAHNSTSVSAIKIQPGRMGIADYDAARHERVLSLVWSKVCERCLVRPIELEDTIWSVTIGRT